jgi:hypothetical protein
MKDSAIRNEIVHGRISDMTALKKQFLIITVAIGFLFLAACAPVSSPSQPYAQITLQPPAGNDPYSAAQATLSAGQVEAQSLSLQSTMVALNLIQAAATEGYLVRQTEYADKATAAAFSYQATQDQQRYEIGLTQTASLAQTQSAKATETAHAYQTATAWPQTATPMAATQQVIIARAEAAQRRAQWEQILIPLQVIALALLGLCVLILLILGAVVAYRRLLPILELRLRTVSRGEHDAPLIILDKMVIDMDRNFGPALSIEDGRAQTTGLADPPLLQERLVARDQFVDIARSQPARPVRNQPQTLDIFEPFSQGAVQDVQIKIVEPDKIKPWLDDVEGQLLPTGKE